MLESQSLSTKSSSVVEILNLLLRAFNLATATGYKCDQSNAEICFNTLQILNEYFAHLKLCGIIALGTFDVINVPL
jgi:hypothetical protein